MRHELLTWIVLAVSPGWILAQAIRFSTENDIFTNRSDPDDLYAFSVGFELDTAPGLRTLALAAIEADVTPIPFLVIEASAGVRSALTSFGVLESHLDSAAPALRLAVTLGSRWTLAWSYNELGDRREHLSLGVVFGHDSS